MSEKVTLSVFLAVNQDGDFSSGVDPEEAIEALNCDHGYEICRVIRLPIYMTLPDVDEAGIVEIPDDAPEIEVESGKGA